MAPMIITNHHTLKPSSPTPPASKIHKLSFIDQISPPIYIPLIFFYKNDESYKQHDEVSWRLKQSLSEILTIFYPLAGTIKQNSFIDCDDTGVEMIEARVHARLQQFTENPNPKMEDLKQLLPPDSTTLSHNDSVILSVKTCFFDCGGFSVGICLSHKIGDAASAVPFMNAWAATCRNGEAPRIIHPSFDFALRFPPRDLPSMASGLGDETKIVTRRLVFDKEMVEKLRKEIDEIKNPSRVEAVSAFLWQSFNEAHKIKAGATKTTSFAASHVVNMRPRAVPPIPNHTFGNCYTAVSAIISPEEDEGGLSMLVSKLRAAIKTVDGHYINNCVNKEVDINGLLKQIDDMYESGTCINFNSWLRFPVYEVDFGWGKPVWVCSGTMPYKNLVLLMDTPSEDGVEAWINGSDQDFFESIQAIYNKFLN